MPSRHLQTASAEPPNPLPPKPLRHSHRYAPLLISSACGAVAVSLVIILAILLYRKLSRSRTVPSDLKPPHRFTFGLLRRATSSFAPINKLGQGGFGSVFSGRLPTGQEIAVKVMDPGSLQGEREFQNELSLAARMMESDRVVSLLGFCSDRKRRHLVLVYELMHNRSLQDALLDRKCPELMVWKKRFAVAVDIARGLAFLHGCDPPIIHGDIKPSNILLDRCFAAKIADFGLARVKTEEAAKDVKAAAMAAKMVDGSEEVKMKKKSKNREGSDVNVIGGEDNGSIVEGETAESVSTAVEIGNGNAAPQSLEECFVRAMEAAVEASPETVVGLEASPSEILEKTSVSEGYFDKLSIDSGKETCTTGSQRGGRKKSGSGKDWWWRQDNSSVGGGDSVSGGVKDYVMEWIGTEIKKERPKKSDWAGAAASASADESRPNGKPERKKPQRRLEWWSSLDSDRVIRKKEKSRLPREWWREEFCEELSKKKKKRLASADGDQWWQREEDEVIDHDKKKKRKKSKSRRWGSRSSSDLWIERFSGELRIGGRRRNSQDWGSGDIVPKSGGVSSTPSMRGTVCYTAPEYGGDVGLVSEKCDVYSFGVLLLVLVSGRRPLQMAASPMSEFERANLLSWARHLAHSGRLLDLVDPSLLALDREEALICISVALLCLQRSPAKRPPMKEVMGMLTGEFELPHLPFEFSPSPPSGSFLYKARKRAPR